jgi:hypothetical protein
MSRMLQRNLCLLQVLINIRHLVLGVYIHIHTSIHTRSPDTTMPRILLIPLYIYSSMLCIPIIYDEPSLSPINVTDSMATHHRVSSSSSSSSVFSFASSSLPSPTNASSTPNVVGPTVISCVIILMKC